MMILPGDPTAEPCPYHTDAESWHAIDESGKVIASAGFFTWLERRWARFNVLAGLTPSQGFAVVRALRRKLNEVGGTIYALNHVEKFPGAERLDHVLGFTPTDEWIAGLRIWKWQKPS